MKKLILILSMFLVSCGYAPIDSIKSIVITNIEKENNINNYCYYYGKGNKWLTNPFVDNKFKFRDTCGKFQIGDTLNIVKQ